MAFCMTHCGEIMCGSELSFSNRDEIKMCLWNESFTADSSVEILILAAGLSSLVCFLHCCEAVKFYGGQWEALEVDRAVLLPLVFMKAQACFVACHVTSCPCYWASCCGTCLQIRAGIHFISPSSLHSRSEFWAIKNPKYLSMW